MSGNDNATERSSSSYEQMRGRLDEIVSQVRSKDVPLEKSLDLYEEALRIGNRCVDMLDSTDFSKEELEAAGIVQADDEAQDSAPEDAHDAAADGSEQDVNGDASGATEADEPLDADAQGEDANTIAE